MALPRLVINRFTAPLSQARMPSPAADWYTVMVTRSSAFAMVNTTRRTDTGTRGQRGIQDGRATLEADLGIGPAPEVGAGADFARLKRRGLGISGLLCSGRPGRRSGGGLQAVPAQDRRQVRRGRVPPLVPAV